MKKKILQSCLVLFVSLGAIYSTKETEQDYVSYMAEESQWYIYYNIPLDKDLQEYTQDLCHEMSVHYPLVIAMMEVADNWEWMEIDQQYQKWLGEDFGIQDWEDTEQSLLAGVYLLSCYSHLSDHHGILMAYSLGMAEAQNQWSSEVYTTEYSREVVAKMEALHTCF